MHILSLASVEALIHHYGYSGIFLCLMLEAMGLPLPGESILVAAASFAAATGELNIAGIVVAGAGGAICGDQIGYLIGRLVGERVLARWGGRIGLTPDRLLLGRYLFRRYGGRVVFFGRFVAILRTFAAVLAGANGMAWHRFALFNAAGGVTWATLYGLGAYFLGHELERLRGPIGLSLAAATLLGLALGALALHRHAGRLMQEAQAEAAREAGGQYGQGSR